MTEFGAVLPRYHVATRVGELDIRDGGDDFREEGSVGRVLGLFKHLRVRVTERGLAHITQPDCSLCRGFKLARGTDCFFPQLSITEIIHYLAGRVDKEIALLGMELGSGDHLGQLLHVGGLDVHDVEGLVRDLHVPQVDAKIVS